MFFVYFFIENFQDFRVKILDWLFIFYLYNHSQKQLKQNHMRKKIIFLLIGWMLVASSGLYAQSSEFVLDDEEVVVTVQPADTVVQEDPITIQMMERVWGNNLEEYLESKIISLSSHPNQGKVSKKNIMYVYKVFGVPCKGGFQTIYLSMTKSRDFILSKEDPTNAEEVCGCYLELNLPEKVATTPSRHQTDDEFFIQPVATGDNREVQPIEF